MSAASSGVATSPKRSGLACHVEVLVCGSSKLIRNAHTTITTQSDHMRPEQE